MTCRLMGVVLCGGQSTRMGRPKATLPHPDGGTFVSHAVQRLDPLCSTVCLSGDADTGLPNHVIADSRPHLGPAAGVAATLDIAKRESFDACFVTPIDMPRLSQDDLRPLLQRWQSDPTQLVCAVSIPGDQIQPLVAIYPVALEQPLAKLVQSTDRSLSRWIKDRTFVSVHLPLASCHNVNTPEDLNSGPEVSV